MPMDGVMLGFIARELHQKLAGGRVDKVTQPEPDELSIFVRSLGENCQLLLTANPNSARAHLTTGRKGNPLEPPALCMLMRKHLVGGRLQAVRQVDGDRILDVDFECIDELGDRVVRTVTCEFMGRHSNLILRVGNRIVDSARHVTGDISRVREVLPGLRYERPPAHGKVPFDAADAAAIEAALAQRSGPLDKALAQSISGLSAHTARELALRAAGHDDARLDSADLPELSRRLAALLAELPSLLAPCVVYDGEGAPIDVLPFPYRTRAGYEPRPCATLSEALDLFYRSRDQAERIKQKSSTLNRLIRTNIERCEKKLALQAEALEGSARMEEYRVKGELLTAGLPEVPRGATSIALPNYYDADCAPLAIELDPKLSPSANAQKYFKRYQKARSAQKLAAEQIERTREELEYLEGQLDNLEKCTEEAELFEVRAELERLGYLRQTLTRRQAKSLPPSRPLRFTSSEGFDILVGKNNLQNDRLTADAQPDEWWLHAKDMPGSHVIVVGAKAGEETLMQAASLAAYYSKGRSSGRVPIDYTRRKHVRKPSGAKPGFVIYTHQRTIYAQPLPSL
ncbi:MAG: fibronectin/fibrinogen-binding protein [Clostridiales bacterium]|nr:fibronectin/fibrinogen-binding protein [Clostridiales bacterium]